MHFIGSFNLTDNIIINDPYAGRVIAEYISLSESNKKSLEINSRPGTWYAYHFYGNYRYPIALILLEEECHFATEVNNIRNTSLIEVGKIISAFGHMVAATDKHILNNTLYTYISPTEDMVYRIKDIRRWLNDTSIPEKEKVKLLLDTLEQQDKKHINSREILSVCKVERIPIESDIWANDCYFRLKDNPLKAATIMGGIITQAYSDENIVYIDNETDCRVIYIDLDESASKSPTFRIIK